MGKVIGVIGILLMLLSILVALFFGFHVVQDSGAISADEAAPGLGAGCCCAFTSLIIAVVAFVASSRGQKVDHL
jgi:hypothetical protein